jgi:hypothetical protein
VNRHLRNFTGLCLIFAAIILPFARKARAAADWPAVTQEELALKDNPAEPGAPAMILFREETVNSKELQIDEYYKIKIFTDAGKSLADREVIISGNGQVTNIQGRTIHPDGKVIPFDGQVLQKTVYKSEEQRAEAKTFTLPDVTPGSIIEFRYRIQFAAIMYMPQFENESIYLEKILASFVALPASWQVQDSIYTRHAHFVYIPNEVAPEARQYVPSLLWRKSHLPSNITPQKQKDESWTLDVNDIAGIPVEDHMLPPEELRGRVEFFMDSAEHPKDSKEYWDKVAKGWADSDERFIGKRSAIQELTSKTVKADDTPEVKLKRLYDRAQQVQNLNYLPRAEQQGNSKNARDNNNVEDVLKHDFGNVQQINLFFVAMAQAAGFDSSLLRAAPRSKTLFHPEYQDRRELSTDFAWVHAGDKDYYLDPGLPYCPFGLLPWYDTAIAVMRSTKQGSSMVQVPPTPSSTSDTQRIAMLTLDEDGTLSGTITVRYAGQPALSHRMAERNQDNEGRRKTMENEIKRMFPASAKYTITNMAGWDRLDEPITVEGKLELPGMGEPAGRRLLLPIGVYESLQRQLFEPSARTQDIYFTYPYQHSDNITIKLPNGMQPAALPTPVVIDPGGRLKYQISAKQDGNSIQIQRQLVVGTMLFPVKAYPALRQFFGMLKTDDAQQIVLQPPAAAGNN